MALAEASLVLLVVVLGILAIATVSYAIAGML